MRKNCFFFFHCEQIDWPGNFAREMANRECPTNRNTTHNPTLMNEIIKNLCINKFYNTKYICIIITASINERSEERTIE